MSESSPVRRLAEAVALTLLGFVAGDIVGELKIGAQTLCAARWLIGQEWFRTALAVTVMNIMLAVAYRLWTRRLGGAPPRWRRR